MSEQSRGFVRNERFGSGQVIRGTNREASRKWRKVCGALDVAAVLVQPGFCTKCGRVCCNCIDCQRLKGKGLCGGCSGVEGIRS